LQDITAFLASELLHVINISYKISGKGS